MTAAPPILRPLSVGELLDHAISLYRKNFVTAIGIIAITNLPVLLLQVLQVLFLPTTTGLTLSSETTPNALLAGVVSVLVPAIAVIATGFSTAALAVLVANSYAGQATTISEAYRRVLKRGFSLFGAKLIFALVYIVLFGPFTLLSMFSTRSTAAGGTGPALVGLLSLALCCIVLPVGLPLYFLFYTRWAFSEQTIVLEDRGMVEGLRRSWSLVSGYFWRVLGIWFVLSLFVSIPVAGILFLVYYLAGLFIPAPFSLGVGEIAGELVGILIGPISALVLTLLYYDLRIRKEGYDLEVRAQAIEPTLPQPSGAGT